MPFHFTKYNLCFPRKYLSSSNKYKETHFYTFDYLIFLSNLQAISFIYDTIKEKPPK